jgi:pimeloyl-ACP methyl ester carboxylesterase
MKLEILSQNPEGALKKTPMLFVHGAWHGAWCWENFLSYFAEKGYPAYAVSLRGHGNSDRPPRFSWMRIADYVADVAQVVEQLPDTPVLVGHSMGGMVVQKYLEDHAAPAAVLLAPVPIKGVLRTTLRIARRHPIAFFKANLTWRLYPLIHRPDLAREAFFSDDMPDDALQKYHRQLQDESYLAFMDMLVFNRANPRKIKTDILLLGAENDTIFHVDEMEQTAAAYDQKPGIFDDMAHDMMLEKNWQAVADRMIAWLDEKGLGE